MVIDAKKVSNLNCQKVEFGELTLELFKNNISTIRLNFELIIGDKTFIFVSNSEPIAYVDNFVVSKSLVVDRDFFLNNKDKIVNVLVDYIRKMNSNSISLEDGELIDVRIISAIIENEKIKKVKLGNKESGFILDSILYKRFKDALKEEVSTTGVSLELEDNFDPMITYNKNRALVDGYNYNILTTTDSFLISNSLDGKELENLKYLNKKAKVAIYFDKCKNVIEIINRIRELGNEENIEIRIEDKNIFNNYLFANIKTLNDMNNISVNENGLINKLDLYYKNEKKLIKLVKPVINLSPFEKYIYIYDLVSKYKKYKENTDDKSMSRDLYKLLDGEYMVCVGYVKLLKDLLMKVGIEANEYSVSVDVGLDDIPLNTRVLPDYVAGRDSTKIHEVLTERTGHARLFVNLVDPKYGIDGYYLADPTWDNDMEHHTFNYALMTHDEFNEMDRYNYFNIYGVQELFFVHSLEEFYYKLNILLDKNSKKNVYDYVKSLVMYFSDIDIAFYQELNNKYDFLKSNLVKPTKEEIQEILIDIGEHIIGKTNKLVDGELFRRGLVEVFNEGLIPLKKDSIISEVDDIIEYNRKRHEVCFPIRYMINREGIEMTIMNATNKFAIDKEKEHKI